MANIKFEIMDILLFIGLVSILSIIVYFATFYGLQLTYIMVYEDLVEQTIREMVMEGVLR